MYHYHDSLCIFQGMYVRTYVRMYVCVYLNSYYIRNYMYKMHGMICCFQYNLIGIVCQPVYFTNKVCLQHVAMETLGTKYM